MRKSNKLTAMQQLIDELKIVRSATHTQEHYNSFNIPIEIAERYLNEEKQQIINAFSWAYLIDEENITGEAALFSAKNYFDTRYFVPAQYSERQDD